MLLIPFSYSVATLNTRGKSSSYCSEWPFSICLNELHHITWRASEFAAKYENVADLKLPPERHLRRKHDEDFGSLFKALAVLFTQHPWPRVFRHTSSIACQKPSAPRATAGSGAIASARRFRSRSTPHQGLGASAHPVDEVDEFLVALGESKSLEVYWRRRPVRSGLGRQPATTVSHWGFWALTEVATFPEVGGQKSGLWSGILGVLRQTPRIPRRVSAPGVFNIRNSRVGGVQRPVAFPRRPVRIRGFQADSRRTATTTGRGHGGLGMFRRGPLPPSACILLHQSLHLNDERRRTRLRDSQG
jgi:hypothetical protein